MVSPGVIYYFIVGYLFVQSHPKRFQMPQMSSSTASIWTSEYGPLFHDREVSATDPHLYADIRKGVDR